MGSTLAPPLVPDSQAVATANQALPHVTAYLARHPEAHSVPLLVQDDENEEALTVPRAAVTLLAAILGHMAAGEGVQVVPSHAELTTQQAADLLNVSRPYLIGLLDARKIDYRKVGKHRRIKMSSLSAYLDQDKIERKSAADELAALTQEMGLI
ncbi:helix-turn-helix domain-containing protein [Pilimelia columellifera]|uniref:Helix-turn-helix domain-containing protein n=1 Tax=Pilimelia columellifera subsp. columellifera TaxID=706583 RepID=A0ABP6B2S2_9ACTN